MTTPKTYNQLELGDSFTMKRLLTMEDVRVFAQVTGDDNPLHIDEAYAATTSFGRPIVHGVFLLGLVSKALGRDFPGHGSVAVSIETKFLRPVPVGEEVTIRIEVIEKIERFKHIRVKTEGFIDIKGRTKTAFIGEATLIPPPEES